LYSVLPQHHESEADRAQRAVAALTQVAADRDEGEHDQR
jgi:hypothetical protein